MDLFEAIKGRRSIRRFKPDQVHKSVISEIIEAASWSPSFLDHQNWYFAVLTGKEKERLYTFLKERFEQILQAMEEELSERVKTITSQFLVASGRAPVVIAVFSEISSATSPNAITSVAAAIQNLLLAAHSKGLGACWTSGVIYVSEDVGNFLSILDKELVALITLGYPDENPNPLPRKRDKIEWRGFDD
ncbi:MAG: hypothetical protein A2042_01875 [Candidatus Schekmanbacteria bacterium GWA2_38_11]|uniref:Nitroreductase domain-containing protein n=1 Tax=Candidatus Schekmanbacteria bacterium GWA2_38_11 TaxID=1817876 RepID=A0A1F7RAZ1_9BACT|nr:MAG: hypothetical protein A2042_01875 [Candidatus Schekmanbacteria bacterium GWA2_38_11]